MTSLRADEHARELVERARIEALWRAHQVRVRRWNRGVALLAALLLALLAVLVTWWRV